MWDALLLSLQVSAIATAGVGIAGVGLGYMLARVRFPGRTALDLLLTLPMILPPTVTGYYLILLLGRKGMLGYYLYDWTGFTFAFAWQGAALASGVVALPIMVRAATAAFRDVPSELEHASYMLGKTPVTTFFRITLPLARQGLLSGLILSFARAAGEFGATLMLAGNIPGQTQTMPLAIYEAFTTGQDREAQILAIMLTLMSGAVILLTERTLQPRRPRWD
ncbi:MAG: molybdate ABC transporter permease subunit [candidate division Zixibacteria bacterium]|nr:molybdate ABC transporter permease subunit [candidate division Zixibacteria bacterium]